MDFKPWTNSIRPWIVEDGESAGEEREKRKDFESRRSGMKVTLRYRTDRSLAIAGSRRNGA